jgi:hypothetical protein
MTSAQDLAFQDRTRAVLRDEGLKKQNYWRERHHEKTTRDIKFQTFGPVFQKIPWELVQPIAGLGLR